MGNVAAILVRTPTQVNAQAASAASFCIAAALCYKNWKNHGQRGQFMPRRKKTRTHKKITGATGAGKSTHLKSIVETIASAGTELPRLVDPLRAMYAELQKTHKPKRKPKARSKRRR